jgi:hypothetical protein
MGELPSGASVVSLPALVVLLPPDEQLASHSTAQSAAAARQRGDNNMTAKLDQVG